MSAVDLDRLQSWLLASKVQQTNNPLYQVINSLITTLRDVNNETNAISSSSSSVTTNDVNSQDYGGLIVGLDRDDSEVPFIIPGPKGDIGPIGLTGLPGLDGFNGEDGLDGFGITGATGATGLSGLNGVSGIDGLDGLDGDIYPQSRNVNPISAQNLTNGVTGSSTIVLSASPALTGTPTAPTQATGDNTTAIATDAFVTTAIANAIAGVNPAVAVQAATITVLPTTPTYNNGVTGIGATITAGSTNTTLTVDGYTPALLERVLVKNQASALQNGVYYVSQLAALGLAWILTRALDYDQPSDINDTGAIPVTGGTTNLDTTWVLTSRITAVGTDSLTYTQFSLNPTTIVVGPASATDGHIAVYDGATGKLIKDGGIAATIGGSTTQVQFNDAGAFAGEANFTWDKTNHRLGIGPTVPLSPLHISSSDGTVRTIRIETADATAANAGRLDIIRERGTLSSKSAVQNGDILGTIAFIGWGGSANDAGAYVVAYVSATPGSGDMPSTLGFYTSADGSSTPTSRVTIDHTGLVSLLYGQLQFPATQNPSSDANTLDDYEEGTWTPSDGSGASLTFTGVKGKYTKIGNMVAFEFELRYPVTADGSATKINGLPFTVGSTTGGATPTFVSSSIAAYIFATNGGTNLQIVKQAGGANMINSEMSNAFFYGSGIYLV